MFESALKKKDPYRRSREEDQKPIIDKNKSMIKDKHEIKRLIDR